MQVQSFVYVSPNVALEDAIALAYRDAVAGDVPHESQAPAEDEDAPEVSGVFVCRVRRCDCDVADSC